MNIIVTFFFLPFQEMVVANSLLEPNLVLNLVVEVQFKWQFHAHTKLKRITLTINKHIAPLS